MKRLAIPILILVLGTAFVYRTAASAPYGIDYPGSSLGVDRTGGAVQALASGNLRRFFATQPPIGPVSVLVRAPFAAIAGIGRDIETLPVTPTGAPPDVMSSNLFASQLRLYRFGVFPCLLALVLLAAAGAALIAARDRAWWIQGLTGVLILGIPLWRNAIELGHPDEFLTTGLTLGAIVAAVAGRVTGAGLLMGLALASKQWALLALPVVALAVPARGSKRAVAVTVATFLALMIPMAAGNPQRFVDAMTAPSTFAHGLADADSIWFRLAPHHDIPIFDGVRQVLIPHRRLSHGLETAIHPAIVLIAFGLALWFWRSRRSREASNIFLLLSIIFLLRCMLDPVTNDYYHAPFLASLALYEALSVRRVPILALIATAAFLPRFGYDLPAFERANTLYLAWSIPMLAFLGWSLYRSAPAPEAVGGRRDRA